MMNVAAAQGKIRIRGMVITPCVSEELFAEELFSLSHRPCLNVCKKARLLLDMDTAGIYLACHIFRGSISLRLCSPLSLHHRNQDQPLHTCSFGKIWVQTVI